MKRSFALAVGLIIASVLFVSRAAVRVWEPVVTAFKAVVIGPAAMAPADVEKLPASLPRVALRRARQFVLRVLKREQPEVTPDCPLDVTLR